MKEGRAAPFGSVVGAVRYLENGVLTHLVIALIGSGIFLRMVAKEKNRRERHLLLRLAQQEQRLAEAEAASQPQPDAGDNGSPPMASEEPVEAQVVGQAA